MVWTPTETDVKILKYLRDYIEGSRAKNMITYIPIKKSTVYKRLLILEKKNMIINDNGHYRLSDGEVKFVDSLLKSDKRIFELHNPGYVVKLIEIPKWWNPKGTQMRNRLMLLKGYQFQQVKDFGNNSSNPYIQLKSDRFIIQMYPEAIIVIHRKRYHSEDPYNLTMEFMNDFYDFWIWFEERMRFKFFKEGVPQMTLRGHDYNRVNSWFSKYVKDKIGHKVTIDIGDGRHVWVDFSNPIGTETDTPESQEILEKDVKDKILNKPLLNSELQDLVKQIAVIQKREVEKSKEYAEELVSHKEAIKTNAIQVGNIAKELEKFNEGITEMNKLLNLLSKNSK